MTTRHASLFRNGRNQAVRTPREFESALERAGTLIGSHDLFIAAHARCLDLTLVTRNQREFARVPGLRVAVW